MNPFYFHSTAYQPPPEFDEAFHRIQEMRRGTIEGHLIEIRNLLFQYANFQDPLTNLVRQWYKDFSDFIRSPASIDETKRGYVELLQQVLIDPLTQTPLDAKAYLGSDGYTYSNTSLCLYLNATPYEHRDRSPVNHPLAEPFYATPHPIARYLVEWLTKFYPVPASLELKNVQRAFLDLQARGCVPLIPTQENRQRRILIHAKKERQQRIHAAAQARADAAAKAQADIEAKAQLEFARNLVQEQEQAFLQAKDQAARWIDAIDEADRNQLKAIEEKAEHVFEAIKELNQENAKRQIAQLDEMNQADQEKLKDLKLKIDNLNAEAEELLNQNQELEAKILTLQKSVADVEQANLRLKISLNETKQAINQQKSSALSGILKGIAIIGISALATYALAGSGTVTPLVGGGKATFIIPI